MSAMSDYLENEIPRSHSRNWFIHDAQRCFTLDCLLVHSVMTIQAQS